MKLSRFDQVLLAGFASAAILAGCSNANFAGSSRSGSPRNTQTPTEAPNTTGQTTNTPTIVNQNPPNSGFQIPQFQPTQPQAPNSAFPNNPLNPPKVIDDPSIIVNTPGQVIFGPDPRAFHIGNNDFTASSCKARLDVEPIKGTKYFFEFEVMSANAVISLQITEVCGVDYSNTNFVTIGNSTIGNRFQSGLLPVHNTDQASPKPFVVQNLPLTAGYYAVVVDSLPNNANNKDRDDFIVGNIIINTNGAQVRGVRVGTF